MDSTWYRSVGWDLNGSDSELSLLSMYQVSGYYRLFARMDDALLYFIS